MTDRHQDMNAATPCGFGIFDGGGDLLIAFPSDAQAREVMQACSHEGYQRDSLEMRPIFSAAPSAPARIAALEAELKEARVQLTALMRQRDELYGELVDLRARL